MTQAAARRAPVRADTTARYGTERIRLRPEPSLYPEPLKWGLLDSHTSFQTHSAELSSHGGAMDSNRHFQI
ncbi:hypothetical protein AOLI_G00164880 [Acnodon oligacanthus]